MKLEGLFEPKGGDCLLAISVSAVVMLGAVVFVLGRYAGMKWWHGAVCALFGFYLAATGAAPGIRKAVNALARFLFGG